MKQNQVPKRWLLALLVPLALLLGACAENFPLPVRDDESIWARTGQREYFPGNLGTYSFGTAQSRENFANIEQAQFAYALNSYARTWVMVTPYYSRPTANIIGLPSYFPLSVRWKLKDGREFILENIDLRPIMREYFKTNAIQMQWEKERRPMDQKGDFDPSLGFEIKDDAVRIKWFITTNLTPVSQRATTQWRFSTEQIVVTSIQGNPTQNINFELTREVKPVK